MTDNIKAFLEADALRTQGGQSAWPDQNYVMLASRIAPALAKMVEDMRVAKEALESVIDSDMVQREDDEGYYSSILQNVRGTLTAIGKLHTDKLVVPSSAQPHIAKRGCEMFRKADKTAIEDHTGKMIVRIIPTNCSKREAERLTALLRDAMNKEQPK